MVCCGHVYDKSNVPNDVATLQDLVINLSQANAKLLSSNQELHTKLDKMTTELQRITRLFEKFFNKSSQKLLQSQEDKAAEKAAKENDVESEPPKGKRGKKGGGGRNPFALSFMN